MTLRIAVALFGIVLTAGAPALQRTAATQPNVLVIIADDWAIPTRAPTAIGS